MEEFQSRSLSNCTHEIRKRVVEARDDILLLIGRPFINLSETPIIAQKSYSFGQEMFVKIQIPSRGLQLPYN
jgi:hypothetical protein